MSINNLAVFDVSISCGPILLRCDLKYLVKSAVKQFEMLSAVEKKVIVEWESSPDNKVK